MITCIINNIVKDNIIINIIVKDNIYLLLSLIFVLVCFLEYI